MSWGSAKFFAFLSQAYTHRHPTTLTITHIPFLDFLHRYKPHIKTLHKQKCTLDAISDAQAFLTGYYFHTFLRPGQTRVASLPRMKGPALLALLPDIPGHCSLLALPDVSPAPLSDERLLDILELYGGINQISTQDKDSRVKA